MQTLPEDVVHLILSMVLSKPWLDAVSHQHQQEPDHTAAVASPVSTNGGAAAVDSTAPATATAAQSARHESPVDYTDKRARVRVLAAGGLMSQMLLDELGLFEAMMRLVLVCKKWHRMVYELKGGLPCWFGACGRVTLGRDPAAIQGSIAASIKSSYGIAQKAVAVISSLLPGINSQPSENPKISILGGAKGWKCGFKNSLRISKHYAKVYACTWGDCNTFASASQDGTVQVHRWENQTATHENTITLASSWVMACALSPSCQFVASGGLDNTTTVHKRVGQSGEVVHRFSQHTGYVSCIKFLSENQILSASGDSSCMLHEVETSTLITTFRHPHPADVMSVCVNSANTNIIATGGCNALTSLYDIRCPATPITVFAGANSDVNCVTFSSNGTLLAAASDDLGCRVYDIRQNMLANIFMYERSAGGLTSADFSLSGHILFCGSDDIQINGWSVLTGQPVWRSSVAQNRVSCVSMSPDGSCLLSGSWDASVYLHTAP
ncbi:guanine nucleotide-binding protein beta subunit [Pelomyxa schiedti]|nr:guanine nucleotide-binding protein beta subunit [Pelomyxa schiedti]